MVHTNLKGQPIFSLINILSSGMAEDIILRLREFIENEGRSCSMDLGGITPEYVYRMWGGAVSLAEIKEAFADLQLY